MRSVIFESFVYVMEHRRMGDEGNKLATWADDLLSIVEQLRSAVGIGDLVGAIDDVQSIRAVFSAATTPPKVSAVALDKALQHIERQPHMNLIKECFNARECGNVFMFDACALLMRNAKDEIADTRFNDA